MKLGGSGVNAGHSAKDGHDAVPLSASRTCAAPAGTTEYTRTVQFLRFGFDVRTARAFAVNYQIGGQR